MLPRANDDDVALVGSRPWVRGELIQLAVAIHACIHRYLCTSSSKSMSTWMVNALEHGDDSAGCSSMRVYSVVPIHYSSDRIE